MNFRAYKKSEKRLLPVNSFKSICINSERLTEEEFDDLVIMRGTGMFDKTGIEIFEGDICINEQKETGVITYNNGSWWLFFFDDPAKQLIEDYKPYNKENTTLLITGIQSFVNY
jgi:hypothetical protein